MTHTSCQAFMVSLTLGGLLYASHGLPLTAQQTSVAPNANGGNTTFSSADETQAKPSVAMSNPQLSMIPDDFSSLRLTPGALLGLVVYNAPEFTTQVRVDDKGDINIPLLGTLHVAGKSVTEVQQQIEEGFRTGQILTNPQVTLNVLQYAGSNVAVLGEVRSPGRFQMLAPHNLADVIAMAGGETNLAGSDIQVQGPGKEGSNTRSYHDVRGEDDHQLQDAMVYPGDTVKVLRSGVVYVLGGVFRPGGYVMQEYGTLNVAQAVSLAQGTLLQAKIGGIRVIRHNPDGTLKEIPIPYKGIMEGKDAPLQLEAQDIVYVPISKVKSVFTAGSTIVGQTGAATIYAVK